MGFDCKSPSDAEIAAALATLAGYRAPVAERSQPTHVVNGDSVAMTLARSGLPGSVIVWRDVLQRGPTAAGRPRRRARGARGLPRRCGRR